MATKESPSVSDRLLLLVSSVVAVLLSWVAVRAWLMSLSLSETTIRLLDIALVVATGLAATVLLVRLIARPVATRAGPTQTNAVKLLLQLLGLISIVVAVLLLSGPTGASFVSALVGIGFFGIVVGLAAQEVLGNIFSGIMLLASRPFHINDRIALVAWQFGKIPPSLTHGWLEPSYTGVVKAITLTYTKILTDSNALLKVPNRIVTQALILNLSYGRQGYVAVQFEIPIHIDPDDLHKALNSRLSRTAGFSAEEETFEILELSPSAYLIAIGYKVDKQNEAETKGLLLKTMRQVLILEKNEVETRAAGK